MASKNQKIALGTAQFGLDYGISNSIGKTSPEETTKILDTAFNHGIDILDTAQVYGDSESVLGSCHGNRFKIITKINPADGYKRSAQQLIQQSLQKLNLDKIYGMLFHSASSAIQNPRIVTELKELKGLGIIEKVGYSVYTPDELNELIKLYGHPDIIQIPFNLLDQRFEEIAQDLHNNGVEVHTRSTFLQGLFFKSTEELPEFFQPVIPYLKELKYTFPDKGQLARVLLSHSLSQDFIDYVVLGVNNDHQLQENLKTSGACLDDFPRQLNTIPGNILLPYLWPK
jgi:aryl-alcohol dehydrogenase-like predicted oxidoreductase